MHHIHAHWCTLVYCLGAIPATLCVALADGRRMADPGPSGPQRKVGCTVSALRTIDRVACAALWRMPAAVSAAVIALGSIAMMLGLATGLVAIIAMVVR